MKRILSILLFCVIAINMSYTQEEAFSAEVTNATIENNCEDGSIDLTITGGYPPYDVIWGYNSCNNSPIIPNITILDFHTASGVQGQMMVKI